MEITFKEGQRVWFNYQFGNLQLATSNSFQSLVASLGNAGFVYEKQWRIVYDDGSVHVGTFTEVQLKSFIATSSLTLL